MMQIACTPLQRRVNILMSIRVSGYFILFFTYNITYIFYTSLKATPKKSSVKYIILLSIKACLETQLDTSCWGFAARLKGSIASGSFVPLQLISTGHM